jgi:hypothetical protein
MQDEIFKDAETFMGVPLVSRYGYQEEIEQMRAFLADADAAGLSPVLRGLYYDSNASLCQIETVAGLLPTDPVAAQLRDIASRHIAQSECLGVITHKR